MLEKHRHVTARRPMLAEKNAARPRTAQAVTEQNHRCGSGKQIQFFRGSGKPAVNRKRATSIAPRVPGINAASPVSASWK